MEQHESLSARGTRIGARSADRRHVVDEAVPGWRAEPLPGFVAWGFLGAFWLFVILGLALRLPEAPLRNGLAAAVALVLGAVTFRVPSAFVVLPMGFAAAAVAVLGTASASNVGWFAMCVLACWCAAVAPRTHALALLVGVLALYGAEALWAEPDPGWISWAMGTAFAALAALLVQHNVALVAQLRAAQDRLADRARVEERNRIARELHDVIGHSLTIVLLHLASARMTVKFDPADAERALGEAERLGRSALEEVRTTVGMLRVDDRDGGDAASLAPLPTIREVPQLVSDYQKTGVEISYIAEGDTAAAPATIGLAAYRIIQEALTNAVKHAPGQPVDLAVTSGPLTLDMSVVNPLALLGRKQSRRGTGLLSMRERAEAVGGVLTSQPTQLGWEMHASLPLHGAAQPRSDQ